MAHSDWLGLLVKKNIIITILLPNTLTTIILQIDLMLQINEDAEPRGPADLHDNDTESGFGDETT